MRIFLYSADKADVIVAMTETGTVMIDTGLPETAEQVVSWMKEIGVRKIDALIITHFDRDHVGGADRILRAFDTDRVYSSYLTRQSTDIRAYARALIRKDILPSVVRLETSFTLDGVTWQIIGARGGYTFDPSNNSSLITACRYGECTYLFMGDALNERIEEFLETYEMHADFLKVPYHGYYLTGLEDLVQAVSPKEAVITNGRSEPPRSELKQTLAVLREYGVHTWLTSEGTVTVQCNPNHFKVLQR